MALQRPLRGCALSSADGKAGSWATSGRPWGAHCADELGGVPVQPQSVPRLQVQAVCDGGQHHSASSGICGGYQVEGALHGDAVIPHVGQGVVGDGGPASIFMGAEDCRCACCSCAGEGSRPCREQPHCWLCSDSHLQSSVCSRSYWVWLHSGSAAEIVTGSSGSTALPQCTAPQALQPRQDAKLAWV